MQPFTTLTGVAVPYVRDNITTDEIAPQQMMRRLDPDYRVMLFLRQRRGADGGENPDFILHQPQFRNPSILVAGSNFGCGSARETAQWALIANGIRCVVAKSFADIFRENCLQNGMLTIELPPNEFEAFVKRVVAANGAMPFTADLPSQRISGPAGPDISFDIAAADRMRLLEGLDDIGMTLKHLGDIAAWEQRAAGERPWLQTAVDRRR
jgi:3-isopropylmalate/(R)-2-methylmalate dehydratase small subunit